MSKAALGPMFEQFIQLVTDVNTLKAQMSVILPGYGEAMKLERRKNWGGGRPRKVETEDAAATPKPAARGPRGPYRKTAESHAATSLNGRLRHLERKDPLRVQTEILRAKKGHVKALAFLNKKLPVGTRNIRQSRLALAAKRSKPARRPSPKAPKSQRPDSSARTSRSV